MSKVIVITGASSGIGAASAKVLANQGNKIVLAARREDLLKEIQQQIIENGGEAKYKVTDVTNNDSVQKLADFALHEFGRIDVWINNAGLMPQSELIKGKVDEWNQMIDVNIKGVLYGINAVLKSMREQKSGHIINISSVAGHHVSPRSVVYSATKYAVLAISDGLRQSEATARSNVRVTVVSPGAIKTELNDHITDPESKKDIDDFYEKYAISPKSIADAIAFAINAPSDTGINEIIVRPTNQSL